MPSGNGHGLVIIKSVSISFCSHYSLALIKGANGGFDGNDNETESNAIPGYL